MDKNRIKERVETLYKIIKDSNIELEELRKVCKHEDFEVGYYAWGGPAHVHVQKICIYCKEALGTPTEQEKIDAGFKDEIINNPDSYNESYNQIDDSLMPGHGAC